MKRKKLILFIVVITVLTLACGLGGGSDADEAAPTEVPKEEQSSVQESEPEPEEEVEEEEVEIEEEEPEMEEPEMEEESEPQEEPVSSSAPEFFYDELDGELNNVDWFEEYSYFVDEDVEEGDDEYTPTYSVEQRRGALRFEIESPYLYLYRFYEPYLYDDVRIDFEVENKGWNTNNVGLVCRYTDYGWYEFITTSGGYYSLMRYYEDGSKEIAAGGIKSLRFGSEKKNVYTAICEGKYMTLVVNDVEIARVKDEEIPDPGYVGFNISSEAYVPVIVEVNWLSISPAE